MSRVRTPVSLNNVDRQLIVLTRLQLLFLDRNEDCVMLQGFFLMTVSMGERHDLRLQPLPPPPPLPFLLAMPVV